MIIIKCPEGEIKFSDRVLTSLQKEAIDYLMRLLDEYNENLGIDLHSGLKDKNLEDLYDKTLKVLYTYQKNLKS